MTATEVMERLSEIRHPRDLEAQIGPHIGWLRSEFGSVMPGLKYLAAIERDGHADAKLSKAIKESSPVEQGLNDVRAWLKHTGQSASNLLSIVGPKMDAVSSAKEAWKNARFQVDQMIASGILMCGILAEERGKVGAKHRPIDSNSFWFREGQLRIDDYENQVVTSSGNVVYRNLRFRTKEVDAFLAAEGGAVVGEPAPQQAVCPPEDAEIADVANTGKRRTTGPLPKKREAAMLAMQAVPIAELSELKVDQLTDRFPGFGRTTLHGARKRVTHDHDQKAERNPEYSPLNTEKK